MDIPDATAVLGSWLHVGSEESVAEERKDDLVSAGVTHVLSVMKRPPPWLLDPRNHPLPFAHSRVKVEDTRAADISEHFETTGAFIRACEASGGRCIVHCAFGQSRSVSVTAAYLMTERHMSLGAALEAIRSRRPHACPNPSFMTQLVRHEMATTGGAPSDLRAFPSLPNTWRFIRWNDPRRQSTDIRVVPRSAHGGHAGVAIPTAVPDPRLHVQGRSEGHHRRRRAGAPPVVGGQALEFGVGGW